MNSDPTTVLETAWCTELGVSEVAPDQNFFDLGGDSLSAIRLMERVEAALGIEFPIDVLFLEGDYAAVAAECAARWAARPATAEAGETSDD